MKCTTNDKRSAIIDNNECPSDEACDARSDSDESSNYPATDPTISNKTSAPQHPLATAEDSSADSDQASLHSTQSSQTIYADTMHLPSTAPVARLRSKSQSTPTTSPEEDSEGADPSLYARYLDEDIESDEALGLSGDSIDDFSVAALKKNFGLQIGVDYQNHQALAKSLKTNTTTKKLTMELAGNTAAERNKTEACVKAISDSLKVNQGIDQLELRHCQYEGPLDELFESISKHTGVKSITLSHFTPAQVVVLAEKLADNRTLKTLTLKNISHPDAALGASLAILLSKNQSLTTLYFSDEEYYGKTLEAEAITDKEDLSALFSLPAASCKLTQLTLKIAKHDLTDTELATLASSLQENTSLKTLELKFTPATMASKAMASTAAALHYHPTLESLQLNATTDSASADCNALAITLAQLLPSLPSLQSLSLNVKFGAASARSLAGSLRQSPVTGLSLKCRTWGKEIASILLEALEDHRTLQCLALAVGPAHIVPHLTQMLSENQVLYRLDVYFEASAYETSENYQSLIPTIEKNLYLTEFITKNFDFTEDDEERIGEALTRNLQLRQTPVAATRLQKMIRITSGKATSRPAIPEMPTEILEQIIATTIVEAPDRNAAQEALNAFMLEDAGSARN